MEASFVPAAADAAAAAGTPLEASAISFDLKLSTATFTFPEPLLKGKGTLKLSFQCEINNQVWYRTHLRTGLFLLEEGRGGKGREGKRLVRWSGRV